MAFVASVSANNWTSELAKSMGWRVVSVNTTYSGSYMEVEIAMSKPMHDDVHLSEIIDQQDPEKAIHDIVNGHLRADGCLMAFEDELLSS